MDQEKGSLMEKKKKEKAAGGSKAKKKRFILYLPSTVDVQPLPGKYGLSTHRGCFRR